MQNQEKSILLSPFQLRSVQLRNRIVVSPMCQYASIDGGPGDWQLVHLGKFALGGAGLIFGEETAIEPRGRKTYRCAGIWSENHIVSYRRINEFLRAHGAVPAIQLGHSGARGSCLGIRQGFKPIDRSNTDEKHPPWQVLCPSAPSSASVWPEAREMDQQDIRSNLEDWREAALRSVDAGFEVLEIHGAHGYLIHQFLSPVTNRRTDAYGGSRDARMRFALEVVETVRQVWPQRLPLFFRISAIDGKGGMWNLEDSVALARELKLRGVDVVDCSSGGVTGNSPLEMVETGPGYQVAFADRVRSDAGVATMAVGLITDAEQAEEILRDEQADLIALARELLWDPNWPVHAVKRLSGKTGYDLLPDEYSYRLKQRDGALRRDER